MRCMVSDIFDVASGVGNLTRWVADGLYIGGAAGARGSMYDL